MVVIREFFIALYSKELTVESLHGVLLYPYDCITVELQLSNENITLLALIIHFSNWVQVI
jgi:hypothetical protein